MNSIMAALLVMLAICLVVIVWIALRRPVMFKIGIRNIPRRPAQSVLVVIGLMLSTLIIAAALGTGDTIDYSATAETYRVLGEADQLVVYSQSDESEGSIGAAINERIPIEVVAEIDDLFAETDLVDGVIPLLIETVPVFLFADGPPADGFDIMQLAQDGSIIGTEPSVFLAGLDSSRLEQFGFLLDLQGNVIDLAEIGPDEIVISDKLADELSATVGDTIGFAYGNQPFVKTIAAIAEDSPLSGRFDSETPGMVMELERL